MKSILTSLLLISSLAASVAASGYEAAIAYFDRERTVAISSSDRQNYLVVDPDIWKYARPDLDDVRLYGQAQFLRDSCATAEARRRIALREF
jgi:hypothetical protein